MKIEKARRNVGLLCGEDTGHQSLIVTSQRE